MEGWVSWESMYDPTMSQTLPPPFPPILTSEIFRQLDSDVAEVIFPLGQTQFGPCCYEDLAQHLLGDHAQLRFAKAQYPGFQVNGKVCLYDLSACLPPPHLVQTDIEVELGSKEEGPCAGVLLHLFVRLLTYNSHGCPP